MSDRSIFFSYSWKDIEDANYIDSIFVRFNITLTRDIRDLKYDVNIHAFMDNLQKHDKLLLFVSDSYLRSINCMYEAAKALDTPEKMVIIVKEGTKLWDAGYKAELLSYWEDKYQKAIKMDVEKFRQEIQDTELVYRSIGKFIDFIKQDKRMNENNLNFDLLFKKLQVEKQHPNIITDTVLDWIARYPGVTLGDVLFLISDLQSSESIRLSEFPNIPDGEKMYRYHSIEFSGEFNGITLYLSVVDPVTGEVKRMSYPHLIKIEENSMRSNAHSKYYFLCENPLKKQRFYESTRREKMGIACTEDIELISSGYTDTYRIIIFR